MPARETPATISPAQVMKRRRDCGGLRVVSSFSGSFAILSLPSSFSVCLFAGVFARQYPPVLAVALGANKGTSGHPPGS